VRDGRTGTEPAVADLSLASLGNGCFRPTSSRGSLIGQHWPLGDPSKWAACSAAQAQHGGTREEAAFLVDVISDEELEQIAASGGPGSMAAARALEEVRKQRAKDLQAVVFKVGKTYAVGPEPTPEDQIFFHGLELELAKPKKPAKS
jgi:hypothetical protein